MKTKKKKLGKAEAAVIYNLVNNVGAMDNLVRRYAAARGEAAPDLKIPKDVLKGRAAALAVLKKAKKKERSPNP